MDSKLFIHSHIVLSVSVSAYTKRQLAVCYLCFYQFMMNTILWPSCETSMRLYLYPCVWTGHIYVKVFDKLSLQSAQNLNWYSHCSSEDGQNILPQLRLLFFLHNCNCANSTTYTTTMPVSKVLQVLCFSFSLSGLSWFALAAELGPESGTEGCRSVLPPEGGSSCHAGLCLGWQDGQTCKRHIFRITRIACWLAHCKK